MKLISWNVNGLRACATKGFESSVEALDADVICLQETKMQPGQLELALPGYHQYFLGAVKKGYSGTAVLTRAEPISVCQGIGLEAHDQEGRVLTCEYPDFILVNCYTPNAQNQLKRLAYRLEWEDAFRAYLMRLDARKPVILCGDLNVAHKEIDLKNPKINHQNAGFSDAEREKLTQLLDSGFIDSFR
ncbi:MAG: exodeoxyribonuclease III, partial [Clostridia bacterium]